MMFHSPNPNLVLRDLLHHDCPEAELDVDRLLLLP